MKLSNFIFIGSALCASIFAQSVNISGTVTNKTNSQPIAGATVTLVARSLSDVTDNSGAFSLVRDATTNQIQNSGFDGGKDQWDFFVYGGAGTSNVVNGEYVISVAQAGTNTYDIQVNQDSLYLEKTVRYVLTFDAYSTTPRPMGVKVGQSASPYLDYADSVRHFALTTVKTNYEIRFEMKEATDPNARVEFQAADVTGDIKIDNVILIIDEGPVQIAKDNYAPASKWLTLGHNGAVRLNLKQSAQVKIQTYSATGHLVASQQNQMQAGSHEVWPNIPGTGVYFHHVSMNGEVYTLRQLQIADGSSQGYTISQPARTKLLAKAVAITDTLLVSAAGYVTQRVAVNMSELTGVQVQLTPAPVVPTSYKPRIIVTTDLGADPDDKQSMVHLLVSSNELDIEGLIVSTGCWRKTQSNTSMLDALVTEYAKVEANLKKHSPDFPTTAYLRSISKLGNDGYGMGDVGSGKDSDGSNLIIASVDKDDPRPVWALCWGGCNNIAQAVWKVRNTRTPAQLTTFLNKLRVYDILGQDDAGAWLAKNFPNLFFIRATAVYGWQYSASWLSSNVQNHGALGAAYPNTIYETEGDSPSFMYLIPNGLSNPEKVDQGNWGGRFNTTKKAGIRSMSPVTNESTYDPYYMYGNSSEGVAATSKWKTSYSNNLQARMDWSIQSQYSAANHHPVAVVRNDATRNVLEVSAAPGEQVSLSAAGSTDPDGNTLSYAWSFYTQPSSYTGTISIQNATSQNASVTVPNASGKSIHLILELKDNGTPNLYAFRRVIINVR